MHDIIFKLVQASHCITPKNKRKNSLQGKKKKFSWLCSAQQGKEESSGKVRYLMPKRDGMKHLNEDKKNKSPSWGSWEHGRHG